MNEPRWSREDVQRVLYTVVRAYEQANGVGQGVLVHGGRKRPPKRFILFGRRLPFLGGDSEILRNRISIAKETLKDNNWWPDESS